MCFFPASPINTDFSAASGNSITLLWTLHKDTYLPSEKLLFAYEDFIFCSYSPNPLKFDLYTYGPLKDRAFFEKINTLLIAITINPVKIQDGGMYKCGYQKNTDDIEWSEPIKLVIIEGSDKVIEGSDNKGMINIKQINYF